MLKQMAQLGTSRRPSSCSGLPMTLPGASGSPGRLCDRFSRLAPALNYPGVKELNAAVKARPDSLPNPSVGPAYASIKVAVAAIERAGSLDRPAIRDALAGYRHGQRRGSHKVQPQEHPRGRDTPSPARSLSASRELPRGSTMAISFSLPMAATFGFARLTSINRRRMSRAQTAKPASREVSACLPRTRLVSRSAATTTPANLLSTRP